MIFLVKQHQAMLILQRILFGIFIVVLIGHFLKSTKTVMCLALLDPSQINWFCISRLVTIIAIGLRNPYAKSESGVGLVLVWCLLTARCLMFMGNRLLLLYDGQQDQNTWNTIPVSGQKTTLNKSNNRTLNKQIKQIEQNRTDWINTWTENETESWMNTG